MADGQLRGPAEGPSLIGVVTIAGAAAALSATQPVLSGTDPFWHWDMGRRILERGLVTTDPYSFLTEGQTWVLNQWGTELLIGLARAAGGVWLVALMTSMVIGAAFLVTGLVMWRRAPSLLTVALHGLVVAATVTNWSLRGNLFTFLLVPVLLREIRRRRGPRWWAVLALFALWANLHAAFLLGIALILIDATAKALVADRGAHAARVRDAALVLGSALLGSVVTPYGPRFLVDALRLSTRGGAGAPITEWAPTPITRPITLSFTVLVVAVLVALAVAATRDDLPDAMLAVAGAMFGISAMRNVAAGAIVVGVVGAPYVHRAYVLLRDRPSSLTPRPPNRLDHMVAWTLSIVALLLVLVAVPRTNALEAHTSDVPLEIIRALDDEDRPARVMTASRWAPAVSALTGDQVRTAVDGRLELFTDEDFAMSRQVESADPGWEETLDDWCITDMIVPVESTAATALRQLHDDHIPGAPDGAGTWSETPRSDNVALHFRRSRPSRCHG